MIAAVVPSDFSEIRWRGSWIWAEAPEPPQFMGGDESSPVRLEARGLFRRTFSLDQIPARAPARITADSRYLLIVNGQEVFHGPIRSQPRRLYYDLFDLAPYLQKGANTLAVYVVYYGEVRAFWMPAEATMSLGKRGVMVFEGQVFGPDADPEGWIVSDGSWKAHKVDAWTEDWKAGAGLNFLTKGIPLEVHDARRMPAGWEKPGFDDSGWANAFVQPSLIMFGGGRPQPPSEPYGPLYPRPIAKLGGDLRQAIVADIETLSGEADPHTGDPVCWLQASLDLAVTSKEKAASLPVRFDVPTGGSVRVRMDLGGVVMGQVRFEVQAPSGALFDFSYSEEPLSRPKGMFDGMHAGTKYIARGSEDRFSVYDALGFRYADLLVHGCSGPVSLLGFAVQEDLYPWTAGASFACSDEGLNRIFKAGVRTVALNSRDAFTDCPTREQQAWVGDSVVHQMVHLVSNCDWRLAWQYLVLSDSPRSDGILPMTVVGSPEASSGRTIPDWSLHWIHGVYNLYRFSGDRAALLSFLPSVTRVLRWYVPFLNSKGQLKDLIEWNLVDWSAVSVEDTTSIITGLWARGLRELAEMAGWLGENATKAWAEDLYACAKTGFEVFWDQARGSYVDHIVDGVQFPEMSQLAGAAAIISGLAPEERWGRIIDWITDPARLVECDWRVPERKEEAASRPVRRGSGRTPTWDVQNQVVLAMPFMSYIVHDAVALAGKAGRLPELIGRWKQFLSGGYDTIGENWQQGTHSHGWSCTPTKDLIFYTLGVTPAEPGYAAVRIAPRLGDLAWAEGKVPSPYGLIHVRAETDIVSIESPVPVVLDLAGKAPQRLAAGRHEVIVS